MEDPDGTLLPPESPNKNIKVETVGATHDGDDTDEMEVEERDDHSENAEDQEITQTGDSCVTTLQSSPKSTTSTGSTDKPDSVVKDQESPAEDQVSQPEMAPPEEPPPEEDHSKATRSPSEEDPGSTEIDAPLKSEEHENRDESRDASSNSEEDKKTESRHELNGSTDKPDSVIKNPESPSGDQEAAQSPSEATQSPSEEDPGSTEIDAPLKSEEHGNRDESRDTSRDSVEDKETESRHELNDKPDGVIKNPETHAGDQVSQPEMAPPEEPPPEEDHSSKESDLREASSLGNKRLWDYGIMGAGVVLVAVLAVCLHAFSSQSPPEQKEVRPVDVFRQELKLIQSRFPTQRTELWRRGRIHLERHLLMKHPTEPVSLILTAGRKAEKTLHCLARGLASAFSSAHNASVLHIDGANKAHLDSDQVKLDIDNQLRRAFEGDKPVAVIHRFEELPPGSTLIFYRYCDHENAAYKKTFLIFTVLLADEEELPMRLSLCAVEEMVDDHLKKKFLSAGQPVTFDLMDLDKYSGLWSRISHLILPVAAEKTMELEGCQET